MTGGKKDIVVEIAHRPEEAMGEIVQREGAAIFLVVSGTATVELNFASFSVHKDSLVFVAPMSTVSFSSRSGDFAFSYIFFTLAVAEAMTVGFDPTLFSFITEYPVVEVAGPDVRFLSELMAGVNHVMRHSRGEHRMQIAENMLQCFYLELYDRSKERLALRSNKVSNKEKIFMQFIALVQQYASTEREITFYAGRLCICNRYLSSAVRSQTGRTPKDFIDSHCLQEIKRRLQSSDDSLQSIALQMHFPDQSFLSRYFKKLSGMTPTEFRASKW